MNVKFTIFLTEINLNQLHKFCRHIMIYGSLGQNYPIKCPPNYPACDQLCPYSPMRPQLCSKVNDMLLVYLFVLNILRRNGYHTSQQFRKHGNGGWVFINRIYCCCIYCPSIPLLLDAFKKTIWVSFFTFCNPEMLHM